MDSDNIKQKIIETLKTVFDPEISVNIYDLGLIYQIDIKPDKKVIINMTLTSPHCPIADDIVKEITSKTEQIEEVSEVLINLVFDPPWDMFMMSDEARLELGFL